MVLATIATLLLPGLHNLGLIVLATGLGTVVAWIWGKRVAITDMPQMVALFNGMGGGSAAAIGAVELWKAVGMAGPRPSGVHVALAVVGALIGAISLTGSVIAWAKLDGRMDKRYAFPGQRFRNALVFLAAIGFGAVAAVDAAGLLRLARAPSGLPRAVAGVAATLATIARAIWGIAAGEIGRSVGMLPWDAAIRLGPDYAWTLAGLANGTADRLWLATAVVIAAIGSR
jgi:hypothetical protein